MTEEKVQELRLTPSQTVGPYLSLGLLREDWSELVSRIIRRP